MREYWCDKCDKHFKEGGTDLDGSVFDRLRFEIKAVGGCCKPHDLCEGCTLDLIVAIVDWFKGKTDA